jgi:hypothetical protein
MLTCEILPLFCSCNRCLTSLRRRRGAPQETAFYQKSNRTEQTISQVHESTRVRLSVTADKKTNRATRAAIQPCSKKCIVIIVSGLAADVLYQERAFSALPTCSIRSRISSARGQAFASWRRLAAACKMEVAPV